MIINHSKRFIFVHIPKTAGTSVTTVLSGMTTYADQELGGTPFGEAIAEPFAKRFGLSKHAPASRIREVVGEQVWDAYFTFTFVRNPFTRAFSTYTFLREWEPLVHLWPKLARDIRGFRSFDEFVLSGMWNDTDGPDDIFKPQTHWLSGGEGEGLLVNFVGRLESLDEDLAQCLREIGHEPTIEAYAGAPRENGSGRAEVSRAYSPAVFMRIVRKYRADFEAFGYATDIRQDALPQLRVA